MMRSGRLVGAAIALGLVGSLAAPAAAEEVSPTGDRAMAQIASCAANAGSLLVSIVVDESGSLAQTDPTNQRVSGISSAIDVLADLRAGAGGKLEVEADLGVFAEGYTPLVSWLPLDQANAANLKSVSAAQLPARNQGRYTDYRAALTGARASLDARGAQLAGTSCKVILWFTDGALDVPGDATVALGQLCGPGGIVDGVREDRIAVIALALFHEPSSVTAAQREQLRAVAEGVGQGTSCGQPLSGSAVGGAFLRADNASALRRVFAGAGMLIGGASKSPSVACPSSDCAGGVVPFHVDRGIAKIQVIVDSPDSAAQVTLVAPGSTPIPLTAATSHVPWGTLDVTQRSGLTTATATFDKLDGAQVGTWTVQALDGAGKPSPVVVDVFQLWDARLVVDVPAVVVLGQASPVTVAVTVAGKKVPATWYKSMKFDLQVAGAPVTLAANGHGALAGSFTLPAGNAPGNVGMTASVSAVSSPSGIALAPVSWSAVRPPRVAPSYPTFTPARLVLPAVTSRAGTTGVLTLRGPAQGTTKACLAGSSLTGPEQAKGIVLSANTRCIDLKAGQTRSWTFTVIPGALADGRIAGAFRIDLTGASAADTVSIAVPVRSSLARPVDQSVRWALFAGLTALSLIVPLLALWIGNRSAGRFRLAGARVASVPVIVTRDRIEPARGGAALIEAGDFVAVGTEAARRRTCTLDGVRFAHTRALWPTHRPAAYATAGPGELIVSGTAGCADSACRRAPLLTALERCWVLVVDAARMTDAQVEGRIVLVAEASGELDETIAARSEMLVAFAGWREVWTRLQAAAGTAHDVESPQSTPALASSQAAEPPEPPPLVEASETAIGEIPEPRSRKRRWVPLDDDGAPLRSWQPGGEGSLREVADSAQEAWLAAQPPRKPKKLKEPAPRSGGGLPRSSSSSQDIPRL